MPVGSSSPDNKAIHDLRDELRNLNSNLKEFSKTSANFTLVLIFFAVFQIAIMLFQMLFDVMDQFNNLFGWVSIIVLVFLFWWILRRTSSVLDK